MSYLLDTNVVSELRKRFGVVDAHVLAWSRHRPPSELYLSVVTVLEVEIGVARVERRDRHQGALLRTWLEDRVLGAFSGRILPIGLDVVRRAALMQVPDPRHDRDAYLAATAAVRGLTVVTRNIGDFDSLGVALVNPWA